jgi:hypothetical protein
LKAHIDNFSLLFGVSDYGQGRSFVLRNA